jgi:hypothetical protein
LRSPAHFVTPELGALYGLPTKGSALTERVELTGVDRRGFLGLAGVLALTSTERRTSPTHRGKFVSAQLLCRELPPPPPDVPALDPNSPAFTTIRAYLDDVSKQPKCGACHALIDPIGLALENYDAIGRFRRFYEDGAPIDAQTQINVDAALPNGTQLNGLAGVSEAVAQSPLFPACTAQKLYQYGFGRAVGDAERANVQALTQRWQAGPLTLRELINQLVVSRPFRARSDGGQL